MSALRLTVISPAGEQWTIDNAQDNPMAMAQWSMENHLPALLVSHLLIQTMLSNDPPGPGQILTGKGQGWTIQISDLTPAQ